MSPTGHVHGGCEANFVEHIKSFVKQNELGRVLVGEVGIYTHHDPDVLFISHDRFARQPGNRGFLDVPPELIVEILSLDNRRSDIMQKLREYFSIGVRLVWIADPTAQTVFAYRSLTDVRELSDGDSLPGDDVLPGFGVPVAAVFEG